jgi:hypothetical protein
MVSCLRIGLKHEGTVLGVFSLTAERVECFRLVEIHCVFERGRPNLRVELCRLDARGPEEAADLLEIDHPSDDGYARCAELTWVGIEARMTR